MSFGQNLQFLRKMHQGMTQDELAEKMDVSRQTISKWEMDSAFPEMQKAIMLSNIFSCTLDALLRENMDSYSESYINIRVETVPAFQFVRYSVISGAAEEDAINHIKDWAFSQGIETPQIIGWDFPFTSQEQVNVFHMHGYTAACIIGENFDASACQTEIISQPAQQYAVITIKEPLKAPFSTIPNAYKTLLQYVEVNNLKHIQPKEVLSCFEKVYQKNNIMYMEVYLIAVS